jgi:hypothetical protein
MASLADIYKSEKKQGGGLASTLGKSMMESFDPRNLLDQNGLLTSMFPSLKGYSSTPNKKKDKEKKGSSGTSPSKASFDETLSNLGTKTTFERLYKAQVISMKYTSVLPDMSKDLKNINKLLKAMIEDSNESGGILDTILDALGLGDMFGRRKVKPGARARLKRIQAIRAARLAAQASTVGAAVNAAKISPTVTPKPTPPSPTKVSSREAAKKIPDLLKKYASKITWKIIPGIGIGAGLIDAGLRIAQGDYKGALIDAAGAGAGAAAILTSPSIVGAAALTAAQVGAFATNSARDIYREAYNVYPEDDEDDEDGTVAEKYKNIYDGFIEAIKEATKNKPSPYDIPEDYDVITGEPLRQTQPETGSNQRSGRIRTGNLFPTPTTPTTPRQQAAPITPVNVFGGQNAIPLPPEEDEESRRAALIGVSNLQMPPAPTVNEASSKTGDKISSLSSDISDARIAAASTPIVTSVPAKSSMNTPPSDEVDMTRLPVASAYNEEFMAEFFGSRQQSFATG